MKPFMSLAETLGSVVSQISAGQKIKQVTLKTWGGKDIPITTKTARQLLEAKCLQGILYGQGMGDEGETLAPDLISSPIIAKEKKIVSIISEEVPDLATSGNYLNLVTVTVQWENGSTNTITGSVFGSVPHVGESLSLTLSVSLSLSLCLSPSLSFSPLSVSLTRLSGNR
jgi:hypothetical protein